MNDQGDIKIYAVLTGDIINFTKLDKEKKDKLSNEAKKFIKTLTSSKKDAVLFRGDSFQIQLEEVREALEKSLQLICWFRLRSDQENKIKIGSKISIGIGTIDYIRKTVLESDGEAFHHSGRGFDELKKVELVRLTTNDNDKNRVYNLLLMYINMIADDWTVNQAQTIYYILTLKNHTQSEIARKLSMSQPNVAKSLRAGKWKEVEAGINYIKDELKNQYYR